MKLTGRKSLLLGISLIMSCIGALGAGIMLGTGLNWWLFVLFAATAIIGSVWTSKILPEGETGVDRMIVMPSDSDDIIFSDYQKVASWGISEPEFFRLTQSQYEKAREILIKYFTDSIKPAESGDYLLEHPSGRLEYTAYPYDRYRCQYFGWRDSEGIQYAYIILVSKELIERDITNGYLNNDKELIWMEDGGSDEVDILINLDENKLEVFGVHQHG